MVINDTTPINNASKFMGCKYSKIRFQDNGKKKRNIDFNINF